MDEEGATGSDNIVTEFNTYEDFLDSQITSLDLYYLEVRYWVAQLRYSSMTKRNTVCMKNVKKIDQRQSQGKVKENTTVHKHDAVTD